jgi:hypothetical protein
MRFLVLLALLPALVVGPDAAGAPVRREGVRADLAVGIEVLHAWDLRRARAWAGSDEAALRSLYVRGSSAGAADVRLLRSYEAHRVVVRRLVTQVFAVELLERSETTLRLRVFDRVAGGEVTRQGEAGPLPSSRPSVREVELRLVGPGWRVAAVTRLSGWG